MALISPLIFTLFVEQSFFHLILTSRLLLNFSSMFKLIAIVRLAVSISSSQFSKFFLFFPPSLAPVGGSATPRRGSFTPNSYHGARILHHHPSWPRQITPRKPAPRRLISFPPHGFVRETRTGTVWNNPAFWITEESLATTMTTTEPRWGKKNRRLAAQVRPSRANRDLTGSRPTTTTRTNPRTRRVCDVRGQNRLFRR